MVCNSCIVQLQMADCIGTDILHFFFVVLLLTNSNLLTDLYLVQKKASL